MMAVSQNQTDSLFWTAFWVFCLKNLASKALEPWLFLTPLVIVGQSCVI